jgi:Arc/MetJ family transcription regulator
MAMKMTMHIDDDLLARVMEEYGLETKTDAVHFALRELDRRARLKVFAKEGLGLTPEELKDAVFPEYQLETMKVAEDEKPYGNARPD